eukprot:TRINITY_DN156975_c0_g1_i1.p1 TRINITY_DN156975_c0_g1~~TRINITY_DN156975_c0_g1_i1.p1  ORF type:complete len:160 (-),score=4.87 TRINITY_DN156975_c0_g1_i1:67-510(-)
MEDDGLSVALDDWFSLRRVARRELKEESSGGSREILRFVLVFFVFLNPCSPFFYVILFTGIAVFSSVVFFLVCLNPLVYSLLLFAGCILFVLVFFLLNPLFPGFYTFTIPCISCNLYHLAYVAVASVRNACRKVSSEKFSKNRVAIE